MTAGEEQAAWSPGPAPVADGSLKLCRVMEVRAGCALQRVTPLKSKSESKSESVCLSKTLHQEGIQRAALLDLPLEVCV